MKLAFKCFFFPSRKIILKMQKNKQILGLGQRTEKSLEHEGQGNTNSSWRIWNNLQEPGEETGGIGNQWENRNHPDYSIAKTS